MSEFGILASAAAGMDAQRFAMDVAARNVAAAQVADPAHPFARLVPLFAMPAGAGDLAANDLVLRGPAPAMGEAGADASDDAADVDEADAEAGAPLAFDDAGDAGTIRAVGTRMLPGVDVDTVTEMVAVLNAQRAYEANASVFDTGKRLAERTIDVGRL